MKRAEMLIAKGCKDAGDTRSDEKISQRPRFAERTLKERPCTYLFVVLAVLGEDKSALKAMS